MKLRSVMVTGGVFSLAAIGALLWGQERNSSEPDRQEDKAAEAEIRRLYDLEHENLLRMDIEAQSQFLPDDFVCTNPFNMFIDKPTVMERMKANIIKYTAYEREYDYFRRYGHAVVVVGSETPRLELVSMERTVHRVAPFGDIMISMGVERYVRKNGPTAGVVRTQRYTNVWRREGDTWRKIARHAHVLPLDPGAQPASSNPSRE